MQQCIVCKNDPDGAPIVAAAIQKITGVKVDPSNIIPICSDCFLKKPSGEIDTAVSKYRKEKAHVVNI